jgi:hypothetical protein
LLRARAEKKELLETARTAARETLIWALDKRQDQIDMNESYYSKDRVTGKVYIDRCYHSVAHNIRTELRAVLQKIMIDPINLFLYNKKCKT